MDNKNNNIIEAIFNPEQRRMQLEMINKAMRAALIASVVQNIACVAAFTFLAITFNHWWIALLAIFFMRDYTKPKAEKSEKKEK